MSDIEFFKASEHAFRRVRDFAPLEFLESLSDTDADAEVKTHFPGDQDKLALLEIREVPHGESVLHYHNESEIFYVVEGELHFGRRVCVAGDSVHIAAGTRYKFKVGPNGVRYLKFTAVADSSVNVVHI